jgi:hypothetical protein
MKTRDEMLLWVAQQGCKIVELPALPHYWEWEFWDGEDGTPALYPKWPHRDDGVYRRITDADIEHGPTAEDLAYGKTSGTK